MLLQIIALCLTITLSACASTHTQQADLSAAVARAAQQASPDFQHALVDLNSDGNDDAIVLLEGMNWCGSGGCTMFVLQGHNGGYKAISRSTVTRPPIRMAASISHGWHDLIVHSDGGARRLQFNGQAYPLNPSMQPGVSQSRADSAQTILPQPHSSNDAAG